MPGTLSEAFALSHEVFEATGAFDAFVGVDARLHIDPHLLASSSTPELADARSRFDAHFSDVVTVLLSAKTLSDPFFNRAVQLLTFRELPSTGLGYARHHKHGSAIGRGLAKEMAELGKAIVDAGVTDPRIFELMGLLQDGIGADRISDMTAAIVVDPLLRFSVRVARELGLPTRKMRYGEVDYALPCVPQSGEAILLVPRDILRHLPVAESWMDIDTVASHNAALRERVNRQIGNTWRKAVSVPKSRLRDALLRNPELLRELLERYSHKSAAPYDLRADPEMLYQWHVVTRAAAAEVPLSLARTQLDSHSGVVEVVRSIVIRFKELIENNRLYRLLYNDDGSPRREKAAQLTLFGVADAYCAANELDLSPEVDAGNGPVDFKISRGYRSRVLVEVKLSSNSRLLDGFSEQVSAYEAAEQAYHSMCVVVRNGEHQSRINALITRRNRLVSEGKRCPEMVLIDGRPSPSASARHGTM